jgi:K+-sensing histidine kinase KdpD
VPAHYDSDVQSRWFGRSRVAVPVAIAAPLIITAILVPFRTGFANADAALVLVAVVVAIAAVSGNRLAGYLAAASSALWFDYFLTRPYEQLDITRRFDVETTVLLLVVGVAVTELAVWGWRQQADSSRRAGFLRGIYAAAEAATAGVSSSDVVAQVAAQLTRLLELQACRFQRGVAGIKVAGRLQHDGSVVVGKQAWPVDERGMPAGQVELLVASGGFLRGRFVMATVEGARPPLEHRLVAGALADQVAAALAAEDLSRT